VKRARPHGFWQAHGHGPALVLINGFAASGRAWPRGWLRGLEQRFRVVTLDNRGSGFSRHPETPFSIADLADDVALVLDEVELAEAAVFGISMGGMIAQELTLRHPERVTHLMLAASRPPNPAFRPPSLSSSLMMMRPPLPGEPLRRYFERLWAYSAAPGFAQAHPDVIAEIVEQTLERPTPRAMLIAQARAMSGWGHSDRLASIAAPALVVHGTLDPLSPVANGRALAELIPHVRYVELEGVGHLVPQEAPEALTALMTEELLGTAAVSN
jgi:pimeloyl-ACP methyl ester carboxylesterase